MAARNGKQLPTNDLLAMLGKFDDMMRVMAANGVTYQSFLHHVGRLYVVAAVEISEGNYSEAGRKIQLNRNHVRKIMGYRSVTAYVPTLFKEGGGETNDK